MVMKNFTDFTENYNCEICDTLCSRKSEYKRHILTQKHIGNTTGNKKSAKIVFACKFCNKEYKSNKGLWSHNKKCFSKEKDEPVIVDSSNDELKVITNLVLELVKSNTELQKQMLDVCKNSNNTNNTIINNNSHNNNKTFNLQFFLNEQCKNAMNLNEFVGSFEFQIEDLLRIGEQGYVEGISYLIIEKLKTIDIYKRPIHCSDLRRDMLYIRNDDIWCKEGPDKNKISIAIKDIGKQNFPLLDEYRKLHPDCLNHDSEYNDPYVKLIMQAAGGCVKENVDKIIKNIMKQVVIEK